MRVLPLTIAALIACILAGCGGKPPINLSGTWPQKPGDYQEVTDAWTRFGRDRAGTRIHGVELIQLYATFKSPEWRAAYVAFRSDRQMLPADRRAELAAAQRAQADDHYEVELLVATYDRKANDLQKGKSSSWRVALVNDKGEEVEADEIQRDRRPRSEIKADFPRLSPFHTPYIARFPRTIEILGPQAREFSLKVASERAGVKLVWKASQ